MPYIITSSLYPHHKGKEVAEKYLEVLKKYPWDETLGAEVVPVAAQTTQQGLKVLNIVETKKGKLEEALDRIVRQMVPFQSIVGFEYSIDIYYSAAEAMTIIGMSLPK